MAGSTKLGQVARLAVHVLREEHAVRRAAKAMPKPVPWDWARSRLLPILAGPFIDEADAPLVRTVAPPGCAIVFGLPLGPGFAQVDEIVAERWECSTQQLLGTAMSNLQERAARLPRTVAVGGTMSGRIVRVAQRPSWVSSLLLVPEELKRLFGAHDQVFAAPGRGTLLSLPIDMPGPVAAEIVVDFERGESYPLCLDPFALCDGKLEWGFDDEADDE
jgi:hypothetical protein